MLALRFAGCLATAIGLFATSATAQLPPPPNPIPQVSPRAHWITASSTATTTAPANRHWSPAASNATSMFVFGGRTRTSGSGTKRDDLYEFDASAMAWDATANRLVMFGGEDSAGGVLGDTWQWDSTNGWATVSTGGTAPSAHRFSAMAPEPNTGDLLLFGGMDSSGTVLNDT